MGQMKSSIAILLKFVKIMHSGSGNQAGIIKKFKIKMLMMKNASFKLNLGDTIGICAPSARFDEKLFREGVAVLENAGFKVKIPEEIFESRRYLAGDDAVRAGVLNNLFGDPDVAGILCARGGYGALRMLDHIDWQVVSDHPKPLVGFSDVTALLLTIMARTGLPVIHGPTVLCPWQGGPLKI